MTKKRSKILLLLMLTTFGCLLCLMGAWIPAKAVLAQILLHNAWNKSVQTGHQIKPWPWADTWPVARLRVPKYNKDMIILHGQQGESLAFGPGMLATGSRPGQPGVCILAGHRDTSFTFLEHLAPGDRLTLEDTAGTLWAYTITSTMVRQARSLYFNNPTVAQLALITCYPFHALIPGTNQRFVVLAERVDGVGG
jgi:sortase A